MRVLGSRVGSLWRLRLEEADSDDGFHLGRNASLAARSLSTLTLSRSQREAHICLRWRLGNEHSPDDKSKFENRHLRFCAFVNVFHIAICQWTF